MNPSKSDLNLSELSATPVDLSRNKEEKQHRSEFDYTMMSSFLGCRRKYFFRHVEGLVSKSTAKAPAFGSAIHKALDSWYKDHNTEAAIEIFKREYKEDLATDGKRTHAVGEWILKNYNERYQDQSFKVIKTEHEFCLKLPTGNNLIGRIDKIIDWDGALWLMDHKTTSQLGPYYFKMHTPNMQFDGYIWAAKKMGYNVQGVLVDAILVAKGLLDSSSRGKLTPLARDFATRSQEDIDNYIDLVEDIQGEINLCEKEIEDFYPNYDACTYYGECAYRKICTNPKNVWEKIKQMDYSVEHWDPRNKEDKQPD